MAIDSRMPADVQNAFNTLLQAELNHEKQMRQARAQQEQQQQLMKLESQKLSNQMFQNALKGQIETKTLQLKAAQQRSEGALETQRFLSEQEDKRQMAREREASRQAIEKLKQAQSSKEQAAEHRARLDQILASGGVKSGHIEQEAAAKSVLQEGKYDRLEELEKLKTTGKMTLQGLRGEQKITYQKGEHAFKNLQGELNRTSKESIEQWKILSREELAEASDKLQRDLNTERTDARIFIANLNNAAKTDIAKLKLGAKGVDSKKSAVDGLNKLGSMLKAASGLMSGGGISGIGGKMNRNSKAYLKLAIAVQNASLAVSQAGDENWRGVLRDFLETDQLRVALNSSKDVKDQVQVMMDLLVREQARPAPIKTNQKTEAPTQVPRPQANPYSPTRTGPGDMDMGALQGAGDGLDFGERKP